MSALHEPERIETQVPAAEPDEADLFYAPSGWTRQRVAVLLIIMIVVAALLVFVVFPALSRPAIAPVLPPLQPPVQV